MAWGDTEESTGLPQAYTGTIAHASFSTDSRYNSGQTLLMIWDLENIVDPDGQPMEDTTEMFSCGNGWESNDGGKTAFFPEFKATVNKPEKNFVKSSTFGRVVASIKDMPGLAKVLSERGEPNESAPWEGLRFEFERLQLDHGKNLAPTPHIMPVAFVGVGDGLDGATEAPKAAAKPTVDLEDQLRDLALSAGSHEAFLDAALDLDGVAEQDDLVTRLNDSGPDSFYHKANA